ncbi:hypothetical protein Moror_3241 [Moniliophthora roreri MCA 2997]|uniref:Uncharacterized protein n=1 Tax=Moniliophthora roreri (strain MCA 2997) TaxID=1381753 RepID=V2WN87_MONRO|nr:hypothetical protein Moror_3241 [Moniliophthora roreri MCA 2997]
MSQSYVFTNLCPTAAQLLYLLNNTSYREHIIAATQSDILVDHLLTDYQFLQQQHNHFQTTGFVIPGQLTVLMPYHPTPARDEAPSRGGLEYPPQCPSKALEDYELIEDP